MSDQDDDTPEFLPATTNNRSNLPAAPSADLPTKGPQGVVSSLLTGFQADMEARSLGKIAKRQRAHADALDATAELVTSKENLGRALNRLDELPEILADDRADRQSERTRRSFEREEATKDREVEVQIRAEERQRKLWEARDAANRAKHKHDATVEFKDYKFDLGKIRADTRRTEAEIRKAQHEAALDEARGTDEPVSGHDTDEEYARLIEARERALAEGNHHKAERYSRAIAALEEDDE